MKSGSRLTERSVAPSKLDAYEGSDFLGRAITVNSDGKFDVLKLPTDVVFREPWAGYYDSSGGIYWGATRYPETVTATMDVVTANTVDGLSWGIAATGTVKEGSAVLTHPARFQLTKSGTSAKWGFKYRITSGTGWNLENEDGALEAADSAVMNIGFYAGSNSYFWLTTELAPASGTPAWSFVTKKDASHTQTLTTGMAVKGTMAVTSVVTMTVEWVYSGSGQYELIIRQYDDDALVATYSADASVLLTANIPTDAQAFYMSKTYEDDTDTAVGITWASTILPYSLIQPVI